MVFIRATQFVDTHYRFIGVGRTAEQALEWPRAEAVDWNGFAVPTLPARLKEAVCEPAVRALDEPLSADLRRGGRVKEETVGPVTTVCMDDAPGGGAIPSPTPCYVRSSSRNSLRSRGSFRSVVNAGRVLRVLPAVPGRASPGPAVLPGSGGILGRVETGLRRGRVSPPFLSRPHLRGGPLRR